MTSTANAVKEFCEARGLRYVGTRGNIQAPVCVVGEAAGAEEDTCGLPFVGPSGRLLDAHLAEADFSSTDVWFTNPFKVKPPDNVLNRMRELFPHENYYEKVEPFFIEEFFKELESTKPTIIIAAGATATSILCPFTRARRNNETPIGKWRGSLLTSPQLHWPHYVVPIHHPAFLLRDWSEKETNIFCLRRAKEELDYWLAKGSLRPLPQRELLAEPSFDDVVQYLNECLQQKEPVSVDIELLKRRVPYTISVAKNPQSAVSVGFWDFSGDHAVLIWRLIDRVLRTKNQIGQNYTSFDAHWLRAIGLDVDVELVDDTRIRHSVLWPELSHKLEFMVMQYTREPYFKDEGRGWHPRDGAKKLKLYNCKDAATTYEVHLEQENEFNERPHLLRFYTEHEMPLARRFYQIDQRGVFTDGNGLSRLRAYIEAELKDTCNKIAIGYPGKTVIPSAKTPVLPGTDVINLSSAQQVIALLKARGLKVPRSRDTHKESSGEEQLNTLFAESGDPVLKEVLRARELNKINGTYANAKLTNGVLHCVYVVGGTVTGRRSSKANPLGFGTNHQNQPKHSALGKKFRACICARPTRTFVGCDQIAAEDWIINGVIADQAGDMRGLDELKLGIDRHQRLASFIFGVSPDQCGRDSPTIYRYVAKRTRYAGCYDMHGPKFAAVLAKEGFQVPAEHCAFLLEKFHEHDPGIRAVFQTYIQKEIVDKRMMRNLLGRERQFMSVHPFRDNSEIFRQGYSWLPQGTVGDNTGSAILCCEAVGDFVVMEAHDALTLEVPDNVNSVINAVNLLIKAFNRTLRFPNGLEIKIPIEIEIGYNLQEMIRCEDLTSPGLMLTYDTLVQRQRHPNIIHGGARPLSSLQV